MTINNRFKIARETLKLSQRDVAEQIGIGATAISRIESGGNNPAERTVKLFCSKLGVSEDWLRTGSGPMMASTLDDELSALAQAHGLDEMDVALIRTYIDLPKSAQAALKDFLFRLDANRRAAENRMPGEWAAELEQAQKSARPESEADAKSG